LRQQILRYSDALLATASENSTSNAIHSVQALCCHRLVSTHNRVDQDTSPVTCRPRRGQDTGALAGQHLLAVVVASIRLHGEFLPEGGIQGFLPHREQLRAVVTDIGHKVELVAQAFHEAEPEAGLWDNEPAAIKQQFREFARNAIDLLNEDIGVLLLVLEQSTADERVKGMRLAAQYLACCSTSCLQGACTATCWLIASPWLEMDEAYYSRRE
jgi:hypothetical protein